MPTETAAKPRAMYRSLEGVVTSAKADKTLKVQVNYQTRHEKYGKYLTRRTVLHVHDEKNEAREGDIVEVAECRPMSKTKHHRLVRVVTRSPDAPARGSKTESTSN
jgi:small subunit ribosomal protein S17